MTVTPEQDKAARQQLKELCEKLHVPLNKPVEDMSVAEIDVVIGAFKTALDKCEREQDRWFHWTWFDRVFLSIWIMVGAFLLAFVARALWR